MAKETTTFRSAVKSADSVVLHVSGMMSHSLKITKAQVLRMAKHHETNLNNFGSDFVDEWSLKDKTLHVYI